VTTYHPAGPVVEGEEIREMSRARSWARGPRAVTSARRTGALSAPGHGTTVAPRSPSH